MRRLTPDQVEQALLRDGAIIAAARGVGAAPVSPRPPTASPPRGYRIDSRLGPGRIRF